MYYHYFNVKYIVFILFSSVIIRREKRCILLEGSYVSKVIILITADVLAYILCSLTIEPIPLQKCDIYNIDK